MQIIAVTLIPFAACTRCKLCASVALQGARPLANPVAQLDLRGPERDAPLKTFDSTAMKCPAKQQLDFVALDYKATIDQLVDFISHKTSKVTGLKLLTVFAEELIIASTGERVRT